MKKEKELKEKIDSYKIKLVSHKILNFRNSRKYCQISKNILISSDFKNNLVSSSLNNNEVNRINTKKRKINYSETIQDNSHEEINLNELIRLNNYPDESPQRLLLMDNKRNRSNYSSNNFSFSKKGNCPYINFKSIKTVTTSSNNKNKKLINLLKKKDFTNTFENNYNLKVSKGIKLKRYKSAKYCFK